MSENTMNFKRNCIEAVNITVPTISEGRLLQLMSNGYERNEEQAVVLIYSLKCHETPWFSAVLSHLGSEKDSRNGCVKLWKSGSVEGGKRGENNQ